MANVQPIRPSRLRPFAGRFDLRMNNNKFGLMRRTINRSIEPKSIQIKSTHQTSNAVSELMRKISAGEQQLVEILETDPNNNAQHVKRQPVPIFAVKPNKAPVRKWIIPEQLQRNTQKTNKPTLYDVSKPAQFKNLTEESTFEVLNKLTLNELCNVACASRELKLAAQKFFEIQFTRVNMSWLIDEGADKFTLLQAQRLLQCFGQFMSTLIVNTNQLKEADKKEKLMEMIGQHCAGVVFWDTN